MIVLISRKNCKQWFLLLSEKLLFLKKEPFIIFFFSYRNIIYLIHKTLFLGIGVINFCMFFYTSFIFSSHILGFILIATLLLLSNHFKDLLHIHFSQILPAVSFYPFEVSNSYHRFPLNMQY